VVDGRTAERVHDERGFTLLELVVAIGVFALLSSALFAGIASALNLNRNNRNRSVSANLASQEMDKIRTTAFTSLPLGLTSTTQTVNGVPYTVQRETEWTSTTASTGPCDAAGGTPALLRVRVSVSWSDMTGTQPVVSDTVLTPPVGAYDPNTGHIAVKIRDNDAAPELGVPVHVTGGAVDRTLSTSSDGCAFFDHLTPGTYTVQLVAAGSVDRQGVASPSQAAGVTAGAVTPVAFDYDRAATLSLTLGDSGGRPVPANVPVVLGNTQFVPNGIKVFAGTGAARSISGLFPSNNGYEPFTGSCLDADPQGTASGGGSIWPGGQRQPAIGVTPGMTSTGAVPMGGVDVFVTKTGVPAVGASVIATHSVDTGCPTGEIYSLGLTDATGKVSSSLPWGNWTIKATVGAQFAFGAATLDPTSGSAVTVPVSIP
jgi:prepilin-type N-terminal cleavage/methylation domain-containing protein